jgi:hypothetical protein
MKNHTCVWRNIYNTARATHSRYYKYFAKHACDFSLILLEPCNFLYILFKGTAKCECSFSQQPLIYLRKYNFLYKHLDFRSRYARRSLRTQTSFPTLILCSESNVCEPEREFDFRDVCLLSYVSQLKNVCYSETAR